MNNKIFLLGTTAITIINIFFICPTCSCTGETLNSDSSHTCVTQNIKSRSHRSLKYTKIDSQSDTDISKICYQRRTKSQGDIPYYRYSTQRNRIIKKAIMDLWHTLTCQ